GEEVWGNPQLNLRIGLCHQYDNFYEDMTALEFLSLVAKLDGFSGALAREQVVAGLGVVGLDEKAWRRPIKTYSKGMRQRVKLAQALMHDPDLLILDEPMTGLDPVGRRAISDLIRERADLGKSVIVSTHILHEVETLTDQILLLANGRVLAEGDVHTIRESLETHPYAIKVVCSQPRR
ncbi:MAG: ABC transporter ATP-binding protein, partial [Myxococcales bacterium]|nr:ABC transporter ATP-binding protein [Myxococcales bacterium]